MDDSKFDLIVNVCLEIANKSWEKNYFNYNFILHK